ncbi:MAG: aldo/keto reductase [bacterium]|jgi:predicted aldo/keto reductase-like oxidoreductase|nr:aldo/keto reductase [bacterium]
MKRRQFIKTSSASVLAIPGAVQTGLAETKDLLPKRPLGETGENLSIIGFGGIIVSRVEQDHANTVVAQAMEKGINYFDVAPSYGDAEDHLGPALEPFRKDVFLACKTAKRDTAGAEEEFHTSLKKLRTDHFDLYQLHALSKMDDLEMAMAPGGAMEFIQKAKEKGLVRYLGFSAHSAEVALAAMEQFDFDTILFPFNYVTWHEGQFGPQVMAKAKEKGVARLALKGLAKTTRKAGDEPDPYKKCWYVPITDAEEGDLALRFTLSLDITAAVTPGEEVFLHRAVEIAQRYQPLTEAEQAKVEDLAKGVVPIFTA